MKFSSQEEYGLRCLLRIARDAGDKGLTIPEISQAEGITTANVAKLLRILRLGRILESSRGQVGGYNLSRPADKILIGEALNVLGGRLYDSDFCSSHSGAQNICTNSTDCSIRSLWQTVQNAVDDVLTKITLKDLISSADVVVTKIIDPNKQVIDISN
jgi:Rrf2 family protein